MAKKKILSVTLPGWVGRVVKHSFDVERKQTRIFFNVILYAKCEQINSLKFRASGIENNNKHLCEGLLQQCNGKNVNRY